ncbi:general stress protein [Syntrophaceticus schinkii]|uniref:Uncharacterized protein n=1 Tax=Syntrophaceticus schinkii TaxID=499207 RepID=A0A0B7MIE8_9FIRM|nr:general stress protein [Syntrophaceticus schinkii]CEO90419.1 hypothetical protein SSCH_870019 [Syntrophaceticus schinkii]
MGSVVLGVFDTRDQAEGAALDLRSKGFDKDISIVARDEEKGDIQETRMGGGEEEGGDTTIEGITTGGCSWRPRRPCSGSRCPGHPWYRSTSSPGANRRPLIRCCYRRVGRRVDRLGYPGS